MDCIVLAGGLGTRLRSAVPHLPKALAPIQGVPFLHLLVRQLVDSGCVSKITLALGYLADEIIRQFEGLDFSVEDEPLGTGGATLKALKHTKSNPVLVINGDTYLDVSLTEMLQFHKEKGSKVTFASRRVEQAERFGTLELSSEGQILTFREKKASEGMISCGFYLFDPSVFQDLSFGEKFSLEQDFFPYCLTKHEMFAYPCKGKFIDIGTPESFAQSQELLRSIL